VKRRCASQAKRPSTNRENGWEVESNDNGDEDDDENDEEDGDDDDGGGKRGESKSKRRENDRESNLMHCFGRLILNLTKECMNE